VVIDPLMRLDERIPSVSAANTSGRRPGDAPPARSRAQAHRADRGPERLARHGRPPPRVPGSAGFGRHPPRPRARGRLDPRDRPRARGRRALLALPDPPTAIFAFNDDVAIGAIQAARARGLRVPDDLSVVGFDDVEHAVIVTPALTTVRQPLAEMGRTAVSLLSRLLDGQSFETLHVELATRLVVRDSTARRSAEPMTESFGCRRCYGDDPPTRVGVLRRRASKSTRELVGRAAFHRPAPRVRRVRAAVRLGLLRVRRLGGRSGRSPPKRRPDFEDEAQALAGCATGSKRRRSRTSGRGPRYLVTGLATGAQRPTIALVDGELRLQSSRLR
jgi:hypothetical protein